MMNELEERLQERLERLEAGEPLAVCLPGLPVEEAELLSWRLRCARPPILCRIVERPFPNAPPYND
jgi:hypothetical protein